MNAKDASPAGDGDEAAKPARRPRSRRTNGSANGKEAPAKTANEATPAEEGTDKLNEDPNPVSA